jgi:hypothetical protein
VRRKVKGQGQGTLIPDAESFDREIWIAVASCLSVVSGESYPAQFSGLVVRAVAREDECRFSRLFQVPVDGEDGVLEGVRFLL